MAPIPERFAQIIDGTVIVHLATVNPDGSPQVSPVWMERDGDLLRFGTAEGRAKLRNLRSDDRVAISYTDPDSPSTSYVIMGRAAAIEHRGWDLMDRLAQRYRGTDSFPRVEGMTRVDVDIEPLAFHTNH